MSKLNPKGYLRIFTRHPSHKPLRGFFKLPYSINVCFRLGSNTPCKNSLEINSVQSIENSSNKLLMKELFIVAGANSPIFYKLSKQKAYYYNNEWIEVSFTKLSEMIKYPVLAKRTYRSRGAGMKKIDNKTQFMKFISEFVRDKNKQETNPYYIEQFYSHSREYRLHVSEFGCFYACRKMLKKDAENRWYRNDSNSVWITEKNLIKDNEGNIISYEGENEKFNKPDTWNQIIEHCQAARNTLGLDVCCFDVKVNKKGEWLILESNSAPSFGSITEIMYKEELPKVIQSKIQNINV